METMRGVRGPSFSVTTDSAFATRAIIGLISSGASWGEGCSPSESIPSLILSDSTACGWAGSWPHRQSQGRRRSVSQKQGCGSGSAISQPDPICNIGSFVRLPGLR